MRLTEQVVDEAQDLEFAALRRNHTLDLAAVENRAHAIAVPGEQTRQHGDEINQQVALERLHRAEIHRWTQVEQEPGRHLAVFDVLADVRRLHARGDIPVNVADIVSELVLAQLSQVQTETVEQRPVVALQETIEAADNRPIEAL